MVDSTTLQAVITAVAAALLLVGSLGVVLPVLPGSLLIIVTLFVWALLLGGPWAWTAAVIGILLAVVGWSASTVLTGRILRREQIPTRPILIALVCAVVGMFLLPPLGLFIGFAAGLFAAEYLRRDRDWQAAGAASLQALRGIGLGILVEFLLAGTAVSAFVIGTLLHFLFG